MENKLCMKAANIGEVFAGAFCLLGMSISQKRDEENKKEASSVLPRTINRNYGEEG